jgi:cytochrome P450
MTTTTTQTYSTTTSTIPCDPGVLANSIQTTNNITSLLLLNNNDNKNPKLIKKPQLLHHKQTITYTTLLLAITSYLVRKGMIQQHQNNKILSLIAIYVYIRTRNGYRGFVRTIQRDKADYYAFPIVGQIGAMISPLFHGTVQSSIDIVTQTGFKSRNVRFLGGNTIQLLNIQDREYVLKTNFTNYTKNINGSNVGFQENLLEVAGQGIFAVDGESWSIQRTVASHMFVGELRIKMNQSFTNHGKELVHWLRQFNASSNNNTNNEIKFLDVQDAMASLTFETICDIAFGIDSVGAMEMFFNQGQKLDFLQRFDRAQLAVIRRFIVPSMIWKWERHLGIGVEGQLKKDVTIMKEYVTKIVQQHIQDFNDNSGDNHNTSKNKDLLTLYLEYARDHNRPDIATEEYLIDTTFNFAIAGRDTTSCSLTNLIRYLTENPRVVNEMRREFLAVVGPSSSSSPVQWEHVGKLRYCCAVFNEVMRLRPPVANNIRFANTTDVLPSGIVVPAGSRVQIPNAAIGRDPHLWNNPNEFIPERWLVDPNRQGQRTIKRVHEYVHPLFNAGLRICLGKDMARLETLNIAKTLLEEFDFIELPGQSEKTVSGPVQFFEHGYLVGFRERVQ